jgi:AAA domain, putative AbiEii toxin, Type IV TA system
MSATAYIKQVSVPRLEPLGGGFWQLADLLPITVLFGKNGSGKSLLLRGWRDLQPATSHYVIPERTGTLAYEAGYLQGQSNPQERREHSTRNYLTEYRQHIIARIQAYFMARGSTRKGQLPGDPAELEQLLATLLPDFEIELVGEFPPFKIKRAETQQSVGGVDELSSGEAQVVTLALDLLTIAAIWDIQKTAERIIFIDEPDAHIHPDLQARFADFLVQIADKFSLQLVIATHSTTLLSAIGQFSGNRCGIIYFDRTKAAFNAQPFTATLKEIAACLGGHALMGPLFGSPVLLVEGDDDYRIWSQVPRHHVTSFSVIPCHGEEIFTYQETLENIFAAIRDAGSAPIAFALLDGDKQLPQASTTPQNHVQFVKLNCHEAENLYMTDEVLGQIGTTWTAAAPAIASNAGLHGAKGALMAVAVNWDRQNGDLKTVINEVSLAVDPKHVHWTQRVGVTIGRSKPTGQLADFLGSSVVTHLWP